MNTKMKKTATILTIGLVLVLVLASMVGCGDPNALKGTVTFVLQGQDGVEINLKQTGLVEKDSVADLMQWANQEGVLVNVVESSTYGAYVVSVGQLVPEGNQYIGVFANNIEFQDTSAFALPSEEIDGVTYYYSGVGMSDIELYDGLAIYFALLSF